MMADPSLTITTTRLLDALRDRGAGTVWSAFDARYRPIIIGLARSAGLTEEDAADAAQQTLAEFARDYSAGKYQRGKGRLRSWLMGIAHHRITDVHRARRAARGESAFADVPDEARLTVVWETEQRRRILEEALTRLRAESKTAPHTMKAFELAALRGMPPDAVARECGVSVEEVYVAKNRVTARLRGIVEEITSAYSEDG